MCTDAAEILLEDLLAQGVLGGVGTVASLEVGYELLKRLVLRVDLLCRRRQRADDEHHMMFSSCLMERLGVLEPDGDTGNAVVVVR